MESRFLAAVDAAVDDALPAGWPRVPPERLPAHGGVQARHAFRLAAGSGPASYLAVVALPPLAARTPEVRCDLTALVDHVIGRGARVLLLYEHEDDPDGWVRERVAFPHPRFLCLGCAHGRAAETAPGVAAAANGDGDYTAEPTWNRREPLSEVIRGLWSRELFYRGPSEGVQIVGLETMRAGCRRCRVALEVVTGIVFPDRDVSDWSRPDWAYYRQLLPLARVPDALIPALQAAVDAWRTAGERRLTVIRWRRCETVGYSYWGAECAACGTFLGDLPLAEEREQWLHDLESRRTGIFCYRPLLLDVPRQALQELSWGWESGPQACAFGWFRAGDPAREPSQELRHRVVCAAGSWVSEHPGGIDGPSLAATGTPARPPGPAAAGSALDLVPAAATAAPPSRRRPIQRLGEILSVWLGWMGSR